MFGDDYITQKYLRRWPDSKRAKSWAGKMVHIRTENGVWRPFGRGYTNDLEEAWQLPFEDAVRQINHCGPEKRGSFILVKEPVIYWTDYPIIELGDIGGEKAPIRTCIPLAYDGDKYCQVEVDGVTMSFKSGYIYTQQGRCGEVPTVSPKVLAALPYKYPA